jgi:hypothetical protein
MSPVAHYPVVALVDGLVPSIGRRVAVFELNPNGCKLVAAGSSWTFQSYLILYPDESGTLDAVGAFLREAMLHAVDPSSSGAVAGAIAPILSHAAILAVAPFFSLAVVDDVARFISHAVVDAVARWMAVGVARFLQA